MKYGIAVFPSKKLQDIANSYRKRYDTKYSLVPPHLTVKEPFEADEQDIQTLVAELRTISKKQKPFKLEVLKYSSFYPATNTLYMKVAENDQLLSLHEALNTGSLYRERAHPFVPHITIGQEMNYDELSDVFGRLKLESVDHEETVDRFQLLYQLENGTWTVYETFLLGEGDS
ncbi:2'-5' RNA ligase family protein [Paenalkalicoccus suaedae]|uniref:Putative phosphoesterase FLK61_33440 n=1 Tax=Paenalkalicoccus suaedae TaxID=2592382 RepID=A0A859FHA9_9BACI|nr:YjcG family protein [Paenalkalicoccus suaedae]QKS71595.1 2'-5' RNA ligase family protein [Paenalkalicoccus suaedae]